MNDFLNKYFCGELTSEEKEIFFSSLNQDNALKEEFIESYNLLGVIDLLSRKGDIREAQESLGKFMKGINTDDSLK